jgi:hypothetical protein
MLYLKCQTKNLPAEFTLFPCALTVTLPYIQFTLALLYQNRLVLRENTGTFVKVNFILRRLSIRTPRQVLDIFLLIFTRSPCRNLSPASQDYVLRMRPISPHIN